MKLGVLYSEEFINGLKKLQKQSIPINAAMKLMRLSDKLQEERNRADTLIRSITEANPDNQEVINKEVESLISMDVSGYEPVKVSELGNAQMSVEELAILRSVITEG
jgi:hypothetical protein